MPEPMPEHLFVVLVVLLMAIPGVVLGLIMTGTIRFGRIGISTASVSIGLAILCGHHTVQEGFDRISLFLLVLMAVSLVHAFHFWRYLLPNPERTGKGDDGEGGQNHEA